MKVTVVPIRAIRGVLPHNKQILEKMELDLNKKEIIYCMQNGNVYDENGKVIDMRILNTMSFDKKPIEEKKVSEPVTPPIIIEPETVFEGEIYEIKINSIYRENNYIILESEFINNVCEKIDGNLYGLFTVTSGPRPSSLEFKIEDNWVKFNNKFADLHIIENGDKFVFRILPKNKSIIHFRLSIKNKAGNDSIVKLDIDIDPNEI